MVVATREWSSRWVRPLRTTAPTRPEVDDDDGKSSAVGGVIGEDEAVAGFKCLVIELELAADGVTAGAEAAYDVAFAANPVSLAGCGARRD